MASYYLPTGRTYLRVNGGGADAAQLYELDVLLENALPAPRLQVDATRLVAESNSGANGVADPRETVRIGVTLSNQGELVANNVVATLTGPSGFTGFETSATLNSLAASASAELLFLFAQDGLCGDTVQLAVNLTGDGDYSESLTIPLQLGTIGTGGLIDEGFDVGSALPSGWSQSVINGGSDWVTSAVRADSPSQSAFSAGVSSAGEALLFSPSMMIGSTGATLSFRHYYDLQSKIDGAVLEVSLDEGAWFDLLNSAATVVSGDYNDTIRGNVNTSLRLDEVWTGNSGGFVTTAVSLPATWSGQRVQFRWRVVHDSGTAGEGWYLDTVSYVSGVAICDPFNPFVSLTASGTSLVENDPAATVTLTLSTPLPLVSNLTVTPDLSGTAEASDLVAAPTITIPAGQTEGQFTLEALDDAISEGDEGLTLSIPASNPGFTPATPSSVTINLSEPAVLPATVTLGSLAQIYDGDPKPVTAITDPAGLDIAITYDGDTAAPTNAGSYAVAATVSDPNYSGTAAGTLVIAPAAATVTLGDLAQTYDGDPKPASATTEPEGLAVAITYDGDAAAPTDAGSYAVVATVSDPNYSGTAAGTLVIAPATATVTLGDLAQTYDGDPKPATATTEPGRSSRHHHLRRRRRGADRRRQLRGGGDGERPELQRHGRGHAGDRPGYGDGDARRLSADLRRRSETGHGDDRPGRASRRDHLRRRRCGADRRRQLRGGGDGERPELQRHGRGHAGDRPGYGDGDAGRSGADLRRRSEAGHGDDRPRRAGGRVHLRRRRRGADRRRQLRGVGDGERRELQRHGRGHAGDRPGRGDGDARRFSADLRRRSEAGQRDDRAGRAEPSRSPTTATRRADQRRQLRGDGDGERRELQRHGRRARW